MKLKTKAKDIMKRAIAMIIAISMVLFQMTSDVVFASVTTETNNYTAIIAEKLNKQGRIFEINGLIEENGSISDMHNGIISFLSEETEVSNNSFSANMTEYANENSIYSKERISVNCDTVKLKNALVAENDITINTRELASEEYTIIYSKNGDIVINISDMNFKGILYAPNGTVTINGTNINIDGTVVAKEVNLYVDTFKINANEFSESMIKVLETYQNDKLLTLTGYTYEEQIIVGFESDVDFEEVDIYIRNDDATTFTYLATTAEEEYTISEYTFEKYMDIMAIAKTAYGDTYDSTLMTVGYSNEEGAEKLCSYANDSDEDGILDGIEIWYSKTNPNNSDSDGDGLNDYIECFYLCTNPNMKNDDIDTDKDGLNDSDEVINGTHPYLKDTDFDGYIDEEDMEPLKYNVNSGKEIDYTEERVIGLFDKVNTWIDENGNVYQYIYNFINDNVEYTMINGVITKYYYNTNDQLIAVVTINEDVMDAVTYTYNGEVLSSVAYNGFLYEFTTTETSENITIAGNSYKDVVYGEAEQTTTYGDGFEVKHILNEYGDSTAIYHNGNLVFECEYDENGQIIKVSDYLVGYEQAYTYKEDGNIATITSNNYNISYEYSDEDYVINYDINGEKYTQVVYNDIEDKYASQYSSFLISDDLHENIETENGDIEYKITDVESGQVIFSNLFTYSEDSKVNKLVYNNGDELTYEYTKDGKISRVLQNDNEVIKYYYDNLGRVVREDNALTEKSYEYIYNSDNNMEARNTYRYSTDELSEILEQDIYAYENVWKDQVTQISGESITYDEIGNPILYRDGLSLEWNGKTLTKVNSTIGDISFTYNSEGIRTSKTVNGVTTEYIIEGKDIIFEASENGTIAYIYDSDMNVIGMIFDDTAYYFEKNAQGDVVRILDEEANLLCEYVYDAWGNIVLVKGDLELANRNPFRYRSYYYDVETGLYYTETRYYDPETGRFINADKIESIIWDYTNLNMYVYCGNDPVNYYDPSGEAKIWLKTFISIDVYNADLNPNDGLHFYTNEVRNTNTAWVQYMNKGGSNVTYIIDSKEKFIEKWNSILYMNAVVIMAHGEFSAIHFGTDIFDIGDIEKLKERDIKFVWMLPCYTGRYRYRTGNFASMLSRKITGVVIAPDRKVGPGLDGNNRYYAYTTYTAEDTTDDVIGQVGCKGWLIYRYSKYNSAYSINGRVAFGGTYEWEEPIFISIYSLSTYLTSRGYVSYK